MSYRVDHVRATFECDCCGLVEKSEAETDTAAARALFTTGWDSCTTSKYAHFCCPGCMAKVHAILNAKTIAEDKAKEEREAACEHDYQQTGFVQRCTKCRRFK